MESSSAAPAEKRRRRPPLACIACRRRKVRCDRKLPCQNCVRARRATSCAYVPDERLEPRDGDGDGAQDSADRVSRCDSPQHQHHQHQHHHQDGVVPGPPYLSPTASHNSTSAASPEQLAERVRQLEQQLSQVLDARNIKRAAPPDLPKPSADPPSALKFLGPEHWQVGSLGSGVQAQNLCSKQNDNAEQDVSSVNTTAILAKSRYLGNSHWIHGVTLVSSVASLLGSLPSRYTLQEQPNPTGKEYIFSFLYQSY